MPLLGSLILGLFSGFAGFLAQWVTKKVALAAAAVAAFSALTVALYVAAVAAINGLIVAFPSSQGVLLGAYLAVPDNGPGVIAACLAWDAVYAVYRWNVRIVNIAVQAQ